MKIKLKNSDSIWLEEEEDGYNYSVGIDAGLITICKEKDCGLDRIRLYSFPLEVLQYIKYEGRYD